MKLMEEEFEVCACSEECGWVLYVQIKKCESSTELPARITILSWHLQEKDCFSGNHPQDMIWQIKVITWGCQKLTERADVFYLSPKAATI